MYNNIRVYELMPIDGRKSFYGKAKVYVNQDGSETLCGYDTPIITKTVGGDLVKHWSGWSQTTGRHIAAFCGLNRPVIWRLLKRRWGNKKMKKLLI